MSSTAGDDAFVVGYGLILLVALVVYIVPAVVAFGRRHPNRYAILVVNLALGGTGLGWLIALVWALGAVHRPQQAGGSAGDESGLNLVANDTRAMRLVNEPSPAAELGSSFSAALSAASAVAELERLSRLQAAGHLSEGEFLTLKQAVLARVRRG